MRFMIHITNADFAEEGQVRSLSVAVSMLGAAEW
jgi:hypothetical protein